MRVKLKKEITEYVDSVIQEELRSLVREEIIRKMNDMERQAKNSVVNAEFLLKRFQKKIATEEFLDTLIERINRKQVK